MITWSGLFSHYFRNLKRMELYLILMAEYVHTYLFRISLDLLLTLWVKSFMAVVCTSRVLMLCKAL